MTNATYIPQEVVDIYDGLLTYAVDIFNTKHDLKTVSQVRAFPLSAEYLKEVQNNLVALCEQNHYSRILVWWAQQGYGFNGKPLPKAILRKETT